MKLWGGRFQKNTDKMVEDFTASIFFDCRLAEEDITGSIAHARMLAKTGIITQEDSQEMIQGLQEIRQEIQEGRFEYRTELEDIHMHIEKRLTEKIGPIGGKLHTARSRNDQVALDMHLYVKKEIKSTVELIARLQGALITLAEENLEVIIPGYTHLQRAQPVLFSHHLMAYFCMLERDVQRFRDNYKRADLMPLGAGALAGTSFPIDREYVAELLDFENLYENSMDAVSDRDYLLEYLSNASLLMMHLSRFCEDLILWSSSEFQFIEMDDAFCTGSSIMPQKKNPDVAELVRGKTGRVYGSLFALLTTMKSLPLTYNKDMQEDKEGLFDVVDTLKGCLEVMSPLVESIQVKGEASRKAVEEDFSAATDLADYLVKKGMPFREAHGVIGGLVAFCLEKQKLLKQISLEELKIFSILFDEESLMWLIPERGVGARNITGGTSPEQVKKFLRKAKICQENNIKIIK
nr:argininosuccinate lyase [Candidatus Contubernalis alkalaceticus]